MAVVSHWSPVQLEWWVGWWGWGGWLSAEEPLSKIILLALIRTATPLLVVFMDEANVPCPSYMSVLPHTSILSFKCCYPQGVLKACSLVLI